MKKNKPKKVRRLLLGVGHPWFLHRPDGKYTGVVLYASDVHAFKRGKSVPLKLHDLGAYNTVRLVAEVLK